MTHEWKHYTRVGEIEARPWTKREADDYQANNNRNGVSISDADFAHAISSDVVGMVARNPDNHTDQWYIAPDYFAKNYTLRASPVARTEGERDLVTITRHDAEIAAQVLESCRGAGGAITDAAKAIGDALASPRVEPAHKMHVDYEWSLRQLARTDNDGDCEAGPSRVEPAATMSDEDALRLWHLYAKPSTQGYAVGFDEFRAAVHAVSCLSASPPSVERLTRDARTLENIANSLAEEGRDTYATWLRAIATRLSAPGAVEGDK